MTKRTRKPLIRKEIALKALIQQRERLMLSAINQSVKVLSVDYSFRAFHSTFCSISIKTETTHLTREVNYEKE